MGTVRYLPSSASNGKTTQVHRADQLLARRAADGDRQAFKEIVERYKQLMFGVAKSVLGDSPAAEDVVQDAFIKAYKALPDYRGDAQLSSWLYRITYSAAIDYVRQQSRHVELVSDADELDQFSDPSSNGQTDSAVRSRQLRREIHAALESLTPFEKTIFTLRHMQNFRLREIAEVLDRSEGTVKSMLFRAIHKLQERLGGSQDDLMEIENAKL